MRHVSSMACIIAAWVAASTAASGAAQTCIGDCNGDGKVTVDEIVLGTNIGLGQSALAACPALDASFDGSATVDELVTAVSNALNGCPPVCDLSGIWQISVTQLEPPEPPETSDIDLLQDGLGRVSIAGVPAFQAQVRGGTMGVDYCDCGPSELICAEGNLSISPDCESLDGVLDWIEFGNVPACVIQNLSFITDTGRERVEGMRK